ncbi:hypothetical protein DMH04_42525 [Kibdelosporangium aridum]|uniref:KAP NTPase domain-containing protein n=1 Tax=Kibdelosporangium aridum TaxID=2030 RepID=A0A428YT61_KIBAR|nr:P-loop NTPase fold protein [Kibdelosporangium aridum]RSM72651.1 hypothetical protein DMH04_42525 [Kibdelosporangium aridum]
MTYLGTVSGVRIEVVQTTKPWRLDVDALVVSAGRSLGNLGELVFAQVPDLTPSALDLRASTPRRPRVIAVPDAQLGTVRWLVVAKAREHDERPVATTIGASTQSAVTAAVAEGARSVAVPLIATGVLSTPLAEAAAEAVPAAVAAVRSASPKPDRVVFFGKSMDTIRAVCAAWEDAEGTKALAGGISGDLIDPNQGIPVSRDHLGTSVYASMLATVIADKRTPTPLSIGVFGEWGSGKSFFMGMMRGQIAELAASGNRAYHQEIVQIGFNAWHYSDTNLWASLGDEIFRQLAEPEESAAQQRARLLAELDDKRHHKRRLDDSAQRARETAARLKAEVDAATADRKNAARDLLAALRESGELRERIDQLWAKLGVKDQAEQVTLFAEQMRGTLDDAQALRRSPRDRYGKVALAASVVILAIFGISALVLPAWISTAGGLAAVVSAVVGSVWLARVRNGVDALRSLSESLHARMAELDDARTAARISDKLDELRRAETDQQIAEAQLSEVVSQAGELRRKLAELAPGQRFYTFIADRANSKSYAGDLGLVSVIRKDFQELVALLADWRTNPEGGGRQPIDRIVLYIDDLDRCGPQQVVDVLQAVHLLLALDLFVVVLGVDPQWLLRALSTHYEELFAGIDHPVDYLEKIINIPVRLPAMPSGSLRRLLQSMIIDAPMPQAVAPAAEQPVPELEAQPGSEVATQQETPARQAPQPQPLTKRELNALERLGPLIETPRKAKRLFNLYRMIRATRDLSGTSTFLDTPDQPGEFRVVVILLGVITADSQLASAVFSTPSSHNIPGGLVHRAAETAWSAFLDDLRISAQGTNQVAGPIDPADQPRWVRLHHGLTIASADLPPTDLRPFQYWVRHVQRFSYTTN